MCLQNLHIAKRRNEYMHNSKHNRVDFISGCVQRTLYTVKHVLQSRGVFSSKYFWRIGLKVSQFISKFEGRHIWWDISNHKIWKPQINFSLGRYDEFQLPATSGKICLIFSSSSSNPRALTDFEWGFWVLNF